MSLIKCPECGKQISDQAESCPSCGLPMFTQTVSTTEDSIWTRNRGCGDIFIFFIILFTLILIFADL